MKEFNLIDWNKYNKPPFWQQWMCEGDPASLVRFGDKNLTDVNKKILLLSDQWDVESQQGKQLDRIGKILTEKRNGNTDMIYRLFLKLRSMLNTADGTINDIIKIIKLIYGSREVRIRPDYPAALVIEYDGSELEYFDYNSLLAQIIPAGVGYHTRALYDFVEDKIVINDRMLIEATADFVEKIEAHDLFSMLSQFTFSDHVYGRSTIVYGGIQGGAYYNGIYTHNGMLDFQREILRYKHNGKIVFGSGLSDDRFAHDDISLVMTLDFIDTLPSRDELIITVNNDISDRFPSSQIYDSKMVHDGQYKWNAACDVLEVKQSDEQFSDSVTIEEGIIETKLLADFNDSVVVTDSIEAIDMTTNIEDREEMDDAISLSVSTNISDHIDISESFVIGMIGYWTYGSAVDPPYTHDGSIKFNYGELSYL
jgi:hypothetical protein